MRLRSPREIADRALQECRNLSLWAVPTGLRMDGVPLVPLSILPDPQAAADWVRGSEMEGEILALATEIRAHRFPLMGIQVHTGKQIHWRRDYLRGKETGTQYFRRIPYLDANLAGDHKIIWELNRHQHLVLLAQAFLLSGDLANLMEICDQLESWFAANPFQRGINWASALEVAFRALSWIWIYHLVGDRFYLSLRERFLQQLQWHARHLEVNLSFYFSPNTHLLGEAVALHAIGALFPEFTGSRRWRELGAQVVRRQMEVQVRSDGAHFEQSTYYHVYALDMFRFHALLQATLPAYQAKLRSMSEFLDAVMGPARRLPFFGDDDGGRLFHPYGRHAEYGRATLATSGLVRDARDLLPQALWWLGPSAFDVPARAGIWASRLFSEIGLAVITDGDIHIVIDAGPFGPWSSGHSHSDTLGLTVRIGEEDILIDPGTYTYVGNPWERDWFRGSAAHNTIRIDGLDQAVPSGPFGWRNQPKVRILSFTDLAVDAECAYSGFTHRRQVEYHPTTRRLRIEDTVSGPPGPHLIEQFWHFGSEAGRERMILRDRDTDQIADFPSWASRALLEKHKAPAVVVTCRAELPQRLLTEFQL